MRENRTCGSEGGEAQSLPYPYPVKPASQPLAERFPKNTPYNKQPASPQFLP